LNINLLTSYSFGAIWTHTEGLDNYIMTWQLLPIYLDFAIETTLSCQDNSCPSTWTLPSRQLYHVKSTPACLPGFAKSTPLAANAQWQRDGSLFNGRKELAGVGSGYPWIWTLSLQSMQKGYDDLAVSCWCWTKSCLKNITKMFFDITSAAKEIQSLMGKVCHIVTYFKL